MKIEFQLNAYGFLMSLLWMFPKKIKITKLSAKLESYMTNNFCKETVEVNLVKLF